MISFPELIALLSVFGFVIWLVSTLRSDGIRTQKLKDQEAINDQNDELLEYFRKEKSFVHRFRNDPEYRSRVQRDINDNKE